MAIVAAAAVLAAVVRRRRPDVPTQPARAIPVQVDRRDFVSPEAPWLVAVFTSATCRTCADVARKARVVASDQVAVQEIEFPSAGELHRRYAVEAVPMLLVIDAGGVVRHSILGPVTATDLWAGIAAAREVPG